MTYQIALMTVIIIEAGLILLLIFIEGTTEILFLALLLVTLPILAALPLKKLPLLNIKFIAALVITGQMHQPARSGRLQQNVHR